MCCAVAGVDSSGRALRSTAPIEAASVTKTFSLVLSLFEDGLLDLDEPVAMSLPGVMPDDASITLRSLLGPHRKRTSRARTDH